LGEALGVGSFGLQVVIMFMMAILEGLFSCPSGEFHVAVLESGGHVFDGPWFCCNLQIMPYW